MFLKKKTKNPKNKKDLKTKKKQQTKKPFVTTVTVPVDLSCLTSLKNSPFSYVVSLWRHPHLPISANTVGGKVMLEVLNPGLLTRQ